MNFKNAGCTLINYASLNSRESEMVLRWRNMPQIQKWMYQDHLITSKEHKGFLKRLKTDRKNSVYLVKRGKDEYIGMISLNNIDSKNRHAYLGIYANPENKLPGYGSILINCIKFLAFKKMRLHTLKLEVLRVNDRAHHFYLKHGFKKEGVLKEFINKNGSWTDVVVMGITK